MEGSGMTVAVTAVTMGPARAGTNVVGSLVTSSRDRHQRQNPEFSGGSSSGFRDNTSRRADFEEYDAGDDDTSTRRTAPSAAASMTSQTRSSTTQSKSAGKVPEPAPGPVMNLLDFDDIEGLAGSSAPASAVTEKALPALAPLGTNENGMSLIHFLISTQKSRPCDSRWRRRFCRFSSSAVFTPRGCTSPCRRQTKPHGSSCIHCSCRVQACSVSAASNFLRVQHHACALVTSAPQLHAGDSTRVGGNARYEPNGGAVNGGLTSVNCFTLFGYDIDKEAERRRRRRVR